MQSLYIGKTKRWVLGLGLLLVLYLVRFALAQDPGVTEEPTALPTEMPIETLIASDESTIVVSNVPQESPTPILLEPTALPTLEPMMVMIPSDEPTLLPTSLPLPTLTPTILPQVPSVPTVAIVPNGTHLPQNSILSLTVVTVGLAQVYGAALACRVDPSVLVGLQSTPGDLFLPDQSVVTDGGFQSGGQWVLIERQMDSAPELGSPGVLWTLNYQVVGSGLMSVACQVQLIDRGGLPLPLSPADFVLVIEGYADTTSLPPTTEALSPSSEVTATEIMPIPIESTVEMATAIPTITLVILEPTLLPTLTPINADVDGNGVVDSTDGALIIANFGLSVPAAPPSTDLNHDGIVNIYDLTILSVNIS